MPAIVGLSYSKPSLTIMHVQFGHRIHGHGLC